MKNKSILTDLFFVVAVILCLLLIDIPFLKVPVAGAFVLAYGFLNGRKFSKIGLTLPAQYQHQVLMAVALSIVIVLLGYYVISPLVIALIGSTPDQSLFQSMVGDFQQLVNTLLVGWIVGALFEELVFHGFLFQQLLDRLPSSYAQITSLLFTSILFGYLHQYQGLAGQIVTGFVGFILGCITLYHKRSIWMSIWVHGFINTLFAFSVYYGIMTS